ncbi:MAG: prolyl oligopeptidase family serine peptidase, partial [Nitrospira sp.]|nr:prolyl oligopeptidase family serine peptidase [Nitrospira sp.]
MMNRLFLLIFPLLGLLLLAQPPAQPTTAAQEAPAPAPAETSDVIEMTGALGLPSPSAYGRAAVHVDALVAKLVDGSFTQPKVGESVRRHDGTEVKWRAVSADDKGNIADDELRGGYLYWSVPADSDEIRILNAAGHSMVYVNGEPRQGDPYGHGFVELPVKLKKGVNHFLFSYGRGPVRAKLEKPRAGAFISKHDMTLPDIVKDELNKNYLGAVVIVNASEEPLKGAVLSVQEKDGQGTDVGLPFISPLSVRKVGFSVTSSGVPSDETPDHDYVFTLRTGQRQLVETDRVETKLAIKSHRDARKVTFISGIDGSVQFYGLRQAQPLRGTEDKPGIVLSLHGAGVDARGQANAYSSKSWCHVVCPTNRRGFGFDWEDWGRLDALEVLQHAQATLPNDPSKVYLTGHSMGGHGTWTVGAHFPDRFAAIGPSAGWIDFWSYSGSGGRYKEGAPAAELLSRVLNPSRTLLMKENYAQQGIYILHGEEDDNVPASEAREMVKQLEPFHRDYVYFEQPGAGHWWDGDDELGAACVDWAPMFDFFARHRLRKESEVRHVSFTTINPGHSAKCHWVSIEQQIKQLAPSKVDIRVDPTLRRFRGTTENVARFAI